MRPNILLITSDQQHWNTIGRFNSEISTPNLNRLSKEGTVFNRAYCPNPTCTPTRASIITGKYPSQHGAWTLGTKLPESELTVGRVFAEEGYRTALIGKAHFQPTKSTQEYSSLESEPLLWDLAFWKNFKDEFYGFQHVELLRNHTSESLVGQHYAAWMEERGLKNWKDYFEPPIGTLFHKSGYTWALPEEFHYDAWIAERTKAMLEELKDESFFLWASFPDPHPTCMAPEPWDRMYDHDSLTIPELHEGEHDLNPPHFKMTQEERPDFSRYRETGFGCHGFHTHLYSGEELKKTIATYYGMISMMDKYIGKILDKLEELGLKDNTIVVFTSDHGHFYGHHGLTAKGAFHYEDMIKVPFIVRYPGYVPEGIVSGAMQSLVDIAPTLLSFCGIKVPRTMTGADQSGVWCGRKQQAREHIICENHHEPTTIHLKTYVDEKYKLTVYFNREYGELYDLEEDPGEIRNLWSLEEYKDLKLKLLMKYIWAELGKEPMWMPRIATA